MILAKKSSPMRRRYRQAPSFVTLLLGSKTTEGANEEASTALQAIREQVKREMEEEMKSADPSNPEVFHELNERAVNMTKCVKIFTFTMAFSCVDLFPLFIYLSFWTSGKGSRR